MDRRTFLAAAGAAASASLAGCSDDLPSPIADPSPTDGASPTDQSPTAGEQIPHQQRYGTVVDLVEAGADAAGSVPIDHVLRRVVGDDTLLYFPSGRYRMSTAWALPSFEHVGLVGHGATIVPPTGYEDYLFAIGRPGEARGFRFEGFTFDFRATGTGPRAIQAMVDDGLVVRDVTVRGRQDTDAGVTRFDVSGSGGSGEVTRLRIPDGGQPGTVATGCLVGPTSAGHVTFEDCHIAGFPDNGLYASPAPGRVTVRRGTYANSGVSNVRVSGQSLVEGVTVRCDQDVDGIENMRGIRLRGGAGTVVRDCRLEFRNVHSSDGAIVLADRTGPVTIENTTVHIDTDDVPALRAKRPTGYAGSERPAIESRGLTVTGAAARSAAIHVVGRPGSTFDDLCVHQTGQGRDGVLLQRSDEARVSGTISVPGRPVVVQQSADVVRSISDGDGRC